MSSQPRLEVLVLPSAAVQGWVSPVTHGHVPGMAQAQRAVIPTVHAACCSWKVLVAAAGTGPCVSTHGCCAHACGAATPQSPWQCGAEAGGGAWGRGCKAACPGRQNKQLGTGEAAWDHSQG